MTDQEMLILVEQIGGELQKRNWLLATAESCTGGGLAAALTSAPGSSRWFAGGLVTYSNAWKEQFLGVRPQTLSQCGAVSRQTVQEMLLGLAERQRVQAGLAVSGIAGPDGATPDKPVGTVFLGVLWNGQIDVQYRLFPGNRAQIRRSSVEFSLNLLLQAQQKK